MSTYSITCTHCQAMAINGHATHEVPRCGGAMTYRDESGRTFAKWAVWSLDVWGNARDGFEVNDRQRAASIMVPADDPSDEVIIRALKREGLLNKRCRFASFKLDGDDGCLSVDAARSGEPIYQLERE